VKLDAPVMQEEELVERIRVLLPSIIEHAAQAEQERKPANMQRRLNKSASRWIL